MYVNFGASARGFRGVLVWISCDCLVFSYGFPWWVIGSFVLNRFVVFVDFGGSCLWVFRSFSSGAFRVVSRLLMSFRVVVVFLVPFRYMFVFFFREFLAFVLFWGYWFCWISVGVGISWVYTSVSWHFVGLRCVGSFWSGFREIFVGIKCIFVGFRGYVVFFLVFFCVSSCFFVVLWRLLVYK